MISQNKAITALIKLQSYGLTDEEILNIYEFVNRARLENDVRTTHSPFDSSVFKSYGQNATNNGSNFGAPKSYCNSIGEITILWYNRGSNFKDLQSH